MIAPLGVHMRHNWTFQQFLLLIANGFFDLHTLCFQAILAFVICHNCSFVVVAFNFLNDRQDWLYNREQVNFLKFSLFFCNKFFVFYKYWTFEFYAYLFIFVSFFLSITDAKSPDKSRWPSYAKYVCPFAHFNKKYRFNWLGNHFSIIFPIGRNNKMIL